MNELKEAWESYLLDSDEESLLVAIGKYSLPTPKEFDFPFAHRIQDIKIGSDFYRVVRLANENESIYIYKCDTPSLEMNGVPYWLKGERLQYWVRLESGKEFNPDYEPENDTNWDMFR